MTSPTPANYALAEAIMLVFYAKADAAWHRGQAMSVAQLLADGRAVEERHAGDALALLEDFQRLARTTLVAYQDLKLLRGFAQEVFEMSGKLLAAIEREKAEARK